MRCKTHSLREFICRRGQNPILISRWGLNVELNFVCVIFALFKPDEGALLRNFAGTVVVESNCFVSLLKIILFEDTSFKILLFRSSFFYILASWIKNEFYWHISKMCISLFFMHFWRVDFFYSCNNTLYQQLLIKRKRLSEKFYFYRI